MPVLRQLETDTLADRAYDAIREAIITGELAPRERITERGLATRLAVSATPVREALRRLEQDQLVERTGPRSVEVASFDDRTAHEARLTEAALRTVAARLAATNATDQQLADLADLLDRGDVEVARLTNRPGATPEASELRPLLDLTREFHALVNEASDNPMLLRLLNTVEAFALAARSPELSAEITNDAGRAAIARYHEHHELLDALRRRDPERAEQVMRRHTHAGDDTRPSEDAPT